LKPVSHLVLFLAFGSPDKLPTVANISYGGQWGPKRAEPIGRVQEARATRERGPRFPPVQVLIRTILALYTSPNRAALLSLAPKGGGDACSYKVIVLKHLLYSIYRAPSGALHAQYNRTVCCVCCLENLARDKF
jgi:hypothetical protein